MMKTKKRHLWSLLLLCMTVFFVACDKDKDDDDKKDPDISITDSYVNLEVTGEVNEDFEGYMSVYSFEFLNQKSWHLTGNNFSPQNFNINFRISEDDGPIPGPGTYKLEDEPFFADFEYIENEDFENPKLYSLETFVGNTGTLTIESLDENFLIGSFNFEASRMNELLTEVLGTVTVSGDFKAVIDEE